MTHSPLKGILLIPALFLAGCANDRYTPTTGDPAQLRTMLDICKHDVLAAYIHANHRGPAGTGLAGGAVVGLIAASANTSKPMAPGAINPAIERCMAQKGYTGTSEN